MQFPNKNSTHAQYVEGFPKKTPKKKPPKNPIFKFLCGKIGKEEKGDGKRAIHSEKYCK